MNKFTLDEAIKHCLEIASENEECAKYRPRMDYYDERPSAEECYQCASEYRQIAKWLTEFKETKRLLKTVDYIRKDELMQYLEPLTNTPGIVIKRYVENMPTVDIQIEIEGEGLYLNFEQDGDNNA